MSVIIPQETGRGGAVGRPAAGNFSMAQINAWRALGWLGTAYLIMSVIDLALGWYPLGFGTPEWEFGTISGTFSGLAIPTLALYFILGSAVARERINVVRVVSIAMLALALFLAILFILYLTSVPLALRAVAANPVIHMGMKKAIVKSATLFFGYETLYVLGGVVGLKRWGRS
jgi:hypothetical protein